jgi:hypothetical protein
MGFGETEFLGGVFFVAVLDCVFCGCGVSEAAAAVDDDEVVEVGAFDFFGELVDDFGSGGCLSCFVGDG